MNGNLERLLTTKQEELRAITVWKVVELEKKYIAKEKECQEKDIKIKGLMTTFDSMRSDFAYNLELLRERDLELERYDKFVKQYRESLNSKDFEIVNYQKVIEELRSKVSELEDKVTTSEAKVLKLTLELAKSREEKKKGDKLAQKESESAKLQFEAEIDFSRRAAEAAEQAAKREALKRAKEKESETLKHANEKESEALKHAKDWEVLKSKLEKSERARTQAEMDLRSFRRENEGKIHALKARAKALESSMEKLTALKERLECENIEKSHRLVEQRQRVEDIQEEIMSAYKGKVQKLIDELTLMKEQHTRQRAIYQDQLTQSEKKLLDQETAHKIELVTASEELDRLESIKATLEEELDATRSDVDRRVAAAERKVDEAERKVEVAERKVEEAERNVDEADELVDQTRAKLVEKDDALIALNNDFDDVRKQKQMLKSKLNNQSAHFDLELEKANEELRKSTKETDMIRAETDMMRARDDRQQEMTEACYYGEKRKLSELVKRLREERDAHFQELTRCRQELRGIQSELEKKNNRALALEEQGTSVRHVITDMRLEMEKMRKKFKRELDRKVEELARYKQKDYDMKRKLANLQVEKDDITLNGSFDTSDIQRELRETKQKLSQLSTEREHLMDINNCLKSDLNKAMFTPIRGADFTPLRQTTYNDSPWARGPLILQKEPTPPTLKRTRLKERLDEIKSELAEQTR